MRQLLLFHINALLKRQTKIKKRSIGNYELDIHSKKLTLNGKVERKGDIVSLLKIEERLWHRNEEASAVHIDVTALTKYFSNIDNIRYEPDK